MRHASLFSGIGGFDLAAEWAGWENMFHCEWNVFGQKILNYYWPKAKSYGDITKTDFTIWRGKIDILTGGFPCQPYSTAGKRLGKDDERHLWPEMLRAIQEIQPRWVVGENVLGLVNWNGGLVFDEVQSDLEAQGYEVQPFILPACAVNAPHRRDRVWFVAFKSTERDGFLCRELEQRGAKNGQFGDISARDCVRLCKQENAGINSDTNSDGQHRRNGKYEINTSQGGKYALNDFKSISEYGNVANSDSLRYRGRDNEPFSNKSEEREMDSNEKGNGGRIWGEIERCCGIAPNTESTREQGQREYRQRKIQSNRRNCCSIPTDWEKFPTQSPICGGNDGLPRELDGITFPKWRAESIKAYGNAIVPQVVYQIFKAINEYEKNLH